MDQFAKAAIKCRKMFESGYDKCYETVTWFAAWLLCWPMKLDFVCNIAEALGGTGRFAIQSKVILVKSNINCNLGVTRQNTSIQDSGKVTAT